MPQSDNTGEQKVRTDRISKEITRNCGFQISLAANDFDGHLDMRLQATKMLNIFLASVDPLSKFKRDDPVRSKLLGSPHCVIASTVMEMMVL